MGDLPREPADFPRSAVRYGPRNPVGFQLRPNLRHIVPEHDNVVLLAVDVADVVAQQCFRLEAKTLKQRDRGLLIDGHLHRQFFHTRTECQREGLL